MGSPTVQGCCSGSAAQWGTAGRTSSKESPQWGLRPYRFAVPAARRSGGYSCYTYCYCGVRLYPSRVLLLLLLVLLLLLLLFLLLPLVLLLLILILLATTTTTSTTTIAAAAVATALSSALAPPSCHERTSCRKQGHCGIGMESPYTLSLIHI